MGESYRTNLLAVSAATLPQPEIGQSRPLKDVIGFNGAG
jgi:hypothetical protein